MNGKGGKQKREGSTSTNSFLSKNIMTSGTTREQTSINSSTSQVPNAAHRTQTTQVRREETVNEGREEDDGGPWNED